ncbi:DUF6503 family protein [Flavobacteriaceae bacterium 3-367]|uniref:DUF6503 family protein n=1 Tax=Eudoraea algarum TaxID=3417568 RepID=UPI003276CBAC
MKTQHLITTLVWGSLLLTAACKEGPKRENAQQETHKAAVQAPVYNTDEPQSILASIEFAHGGWNDLWGKKDVEYTYDYRYPSNGKADVSTERYMFDSETSYGSYEKHEINVMPETTGQVSQFFNGAETLVMHDGQKVEDPQAAGTGDFLRRANYFWFVMPYKLNDKGTLASYQGQEVYDGKSYDKLEVTYDPEITGKEQNDTYILYVNPETKLIDRFYFSLPFLGVNDPVIIANYEYEEVDGQMIATKRSYFMPNDKGEYGEDPSIVQTLSNIKFNNGFTKETILEHP